MGRTVTWTPALATGVAELDAQHEELFRRADAFLDALEASSPADVARLLSFLRDHVAAHFSAEEDWMRAAGYPDLESHRAEHARFAAQLAAYAGGDGAAERPAELAAWLVRWLHDHIVRADGAAARFVRSRSGPHPGA